MTNSKASAPCPCGGKDYASCCRRFHEGTIAPSAESLMRSRYSAYVLARTDYLLATWHVATRPVDLQLDTPEHKHTRWLGLTVKSAEEQGDKAVVEFVARFRVGGGSAQRLHELSRFERIDGRWYYCDGQFKH